ncbi:alpha-ketoacid dehydrogenase subunit beta [Patulibacter defluvii]|uniref:alpha-ketoacid dehydrogenase subunit beta n=1 Tax=Patulibacter defluvii TaxID=3095358 RepID=UPI002A752E59|nr:transketolase C-terminal domain-containing protein [Patulibacter sp. DM4]
MADPRPPRYLDGVREGLAAEMEADPDVVLIGVDVGAGGGVFGATRGLQERFGPERVIDTPIAEAGVLGAAVGAAMAGLRPVAEVMYMDFVTVCLDPIVNQAAKLRYMTGGGARIPIVFRTQTGGGRSSGAQHSQSLEGLLAHVPGLKVFLPSDPRDVADLLRAAIRDDGPVVFVENRRLYNRRAPEGPWEPLPPGRARTVRAGDDVTVIAWGRMVDEVARACDEHLPDVGVELLDLRTLAPLDHEGLERSVRRTGRALIVHEAVADFGPGAEIATRLTERLLYEVEGPIRRLGAVAAPTPYSPPLEALALPGPEAIAAAVRGLVEE